MKKLFRFLVICMAVVTAACSEGEGDGELSFTISAPAVSGVTQTEAVVTATVGFDAELYSHAKVGFLYGPADAAESSYRTAEPSLVSGRAVKAELSGLEPDSDYMVHGFVQMGAIRTLSLAAEFRTLAVGEKPDPKPEPVDPTFGTPSVSSVTASGAVLSASFAYDGEEAVKAVWFSLTPEGGAEQKITLSTSAGTKSTTVDNLEEQTNYSFCLAVEVNNKIYKSASKGFTTEKGNTGGGGGSQIPGNTKYSGWPELVPEIDNSDYHYAYHICPDLKINGIQARNYAVCFSERHHCPVWVAAPRHKCYEGSAKRTNAYGKDPDIEGSIQYHSTSTGSGCNKGHMLGSKERTRSTAINKQVFYYTNIAPQYQSGYNTGGGGWNTLEDWIDGKVCSDTTYLVIGTYFEKYTDGYGHSASPKKIEFCGRSDVSCPTMFYIAVLRTKRGNTGKSVMNCSSDELMAAAFVRSHNNSLKGQDVTRKEMMSIDDLEKLTGFDYFSNIPNAPESSFNPSDWGL